MVDYHTTILTTPRQAHPQPSHTCQHIHDPHQTSFWDSFLICEGGEGCFYLHTDTSQGCYEIQVGRTRGGPAQAAGSQVI